MFAKAAMVNTVKFIGLTACFLSPVHLVAVPKDTSPEIILSHNESAATDAGQKGKRGGIQIPFQIVNRYILIPVRVNGGETLKFVLDTGAPITVIIENDNTRTLPITLGAEIEVSGAGKGEAPTANVVSNTQVKVGSIEIEDLVSLWLPRSSMPYLDHPEDGYFDGIIGYDLFSRFSVLVDYDTKKISFFPKATMPDSPESWQKIALQFNSKHPYLSASVVAENGNSAEVKLLLDTGSTNALILSPSAHPAIGWPEKYYISESKGLSGVEVEHTSIASEINLGQHQLSNFEAVYADTWVEAGSHGILGNAILSRFNLLFDYQSKILWIQSHSAPKARLNIDRSGMKTLPLSEGARVVKLYPESNAHRLGLQEGDLIVSIQGTPISEANYDKFIDLFRSDGDNFSICWKRRVEGVLRKEPECGSLKMINREF